MSPSPARPGSPTNRACADSATLAIKSRQLCIYIYIYIHMYNTFNYIYIYIIVCMIIL